MSRFGGENLKKLGFFENAPILRTRENEIKAHLEKSFRLGVHLYV